MARQVRAAVSAVSNVADVLGKLIASPRGNGPGAPVIVRGSQVAEWLGITDRAVRKMMDRGELPWTWLGRQRVVPLAIWMDRLAAEAKANGQPECAE